MNGVAYKYTNTSGVDRVRKYYHVAFRHFSNFTNEYIAHRVARIWNEYYKKSDFETAFSPDDRAILDTPFICGEKVNTYDYNIKYRDVVNRNLDKKGLYMNDNCASNAVIKNGYPYLIDFDEVYHRLKDGRNGSIASRFDSGDLKYFKEI